MTDLALIVLEPPKSYYSHEDERHFSQWLENIAAFEMARSTSHGLEVFVKTPIDQDSLYSLIGLLFRYGMDPRPLRALSHAEIDDWFQNKTMYWHDAVFNDGATVLDDKPAGVGPCPRCGKRAPHRMRRKAMLVVLAVLMAVIAIYFFSRP